MSNSPKPSKRILTVQVTREMFYQLQHEAKERKMLLSEYVRFVLAEAVIDVVLTQEELDAIKEETEAAREKKH